MRVGWASTPRRAAGLLLMAALLSSCASAPAVAGSTAGCADATPVRAVDAAFDKLLTAVESPDTTALPHLIEQGLGMTFVQGDPAKLPRWERAHYAGRDDASGLSVQVVIEASMTSVVVTPPACAAAADAQPVCLSLDAIEPVLARHRWSARGRVQGSSILQYESDPQPNRGAEFLLFAEPRALQRCVRSATLRIINH